MKAVSVTIEAGSNASEKVFRFNKKLTDDELQFRSAEESFQSPLANKIFGFPWTEAVTIQEDAVIIEKQDWVEWDVLAEPLAGLLKEHVELDLPIYSKPQEKADVEPRSFSVEWQPTPNPEALKFVVDHTLCEESYEYNDSEAAQESEIATKLFEFPWVESIFIGINFITIRKQEWAEWEPLRDPVAKLIKEHLDGGGKVAPLSSQSEILDSDSDSVKTIKKILNEEIRPAVAQDGGDVAFHSYEDGVLQLHMKGACAGCPSATATLKMGIETRLREFLPEIKDVIAV